jgi:hypothetical protein
MSGDELTPYEQRELDRIRRQLHGTPPPLPVNRLSAHIEEDLAYKAEFTAMKGVDVGRRLADGVTQMHEDFADRAHGDPFLAQLLSRIEAATVIAGTELIESYMAHLFRGDDNGGPVPARRR